MTGNVRRPDPAAGAGAMTAEDYIAFLDRTSTQTGQRHRALDLLRLSQGRRCLDIGCGVGEDTRAMAGAFGAEAVGIDVNPRMVEEAQSRSAGRPGVTFRVGDASSLPFPDASFDAGWVKRTLMHIAEPARVIAEMVRVIRPGGRVVAVEPDLEVVLLVEVTRKVLARRAAGYANAWAGRRLRRLLLEAGLSGVRAAAEPMEVPGVDAMQTALRLLSLAQSAVSDGELTSEEAAAWEEDLRAREGAGLFGCWAFMFVAWGNVPAAATPAR